MTTQQISDYALLGDLHTAALVHRDGSIDWLCLPRFDSPSAFGALLDPGAGSWQLRPDGEARPARRYEPGTLVLETTWTTASGTARVLDLMPPRGEACDVVRLVEGVDGTVPFTSTVTPRFDYGAIVPWLEEVSGGSGRAGQATARICAIGGPDALWLDPPDGSDTSVADGTVTSRFTVSPGQRLAFVLTYSPSYLAQPQRIDPSKALDETRGFWREWVAGGDWPEAWGEAVSRSLITLKALTYAPSGGIVAAPTTSVPEDLGGVRNWDYRFCWLRDASFTLQALLGAGFVDEARAWREWLVRAVAGDPSKLQIMYGIDGRRRLSEFELEGLAGFAGSRPVRVGNAASGQYQLDVWGEVLDALHQARHAGIEESESAWQVQGALLDFLEGHWARPDASLWEVRGPERQFVHSKVLAWAGVDRVVHTLDAVPQLDGDPARWRALRDTIHRSVCTEGFDAAANTFTQYYGSKDVDAALLLLPRVGFLAWDDPRIAGTVAAVERDLRDGPFVQRYRTHGEVDGLPGGEGAFLACSFWLVDALAGLHRTDEATALFEQLLELRNDVGLLAEEWDVARGCQVGNFPQAFSHVGLVNSARQLQQGVETTRVPTPVD